MSKKFHSKRKTKPTASLPKKVPLDTSITTTTTSNSPSFLTPCHPDFPLILANHYQGFVHENATSFPTLFHARNKTLFEKLRDGNYFQYDLIRAGGKTMSKTFVKRTLVGEPGITYKYLGLRIFAHSWKGPNSNPLFREVFALNQEMIKRTQAAKKNEEGKLAGSSQYNLTLINYMEPVAASASHRLKEDELYGMGKVSVSWHADSALQDFSSIGVYHTLLSKPTAGCDWRIALRKSPEVEDGTPPIVVSTKSGDTYYLLGDFNHHRQHMVLAGSGVRVSSTHRVAVETEDTLDYILFKTKTVMALLQDDNIALESEKLNTIQALLTELEMEWIRQYWSQGKTHHALHIDWHKPISKLEKSWKALEMFTHDLFLTYTVHHTQVDDIKSLLKCVKVLRCALETRQRHRSTWKTRLDDKAYRKLSSDHQPIHRPELNTTDRTMLPEELTTSIQDLQTLGTVLQQTIKAQHRKRKMK